jgi:hypothetical protein
MDPRNIPLVTRTATPGVAPTAAQVRQELVANLLGALYLAVTDSAGNIVNAQDLQSDTNAATAAQRFAQRSAAYLYGKDHIAANDWLRIEAALIGETLSAPDGPAGIISVAAMYTRDDDDGDCRSTFGDGGQTDTMLPGIWGLLTSSRLMGYNSFRDEWSRLLDGSQGNLALLDAKRSLVVSRPGEWTLASAPAAATAATATRAAGTLDTRHVLRSFTADLNAVNAQAAPVEFVVRDGLTGAGTILWRRRLIALAGDTRSIEIGGLNIIGSPNTAMTVETTGAPAAGNFVTISATGVSAST